MKKERLRFITCGSVDDGKSTLIGRLLYDLDAVSSDKLSAASIDSKKHGTVGGGLDLALLTDGLKAEREQGITIDVAHLFFSSKTRSYIVADAPGHEQYTRNMATAASEADAAIILIDARKGVLTQTKRHAFLASLFGVRHIIVAVNKIDALGYSEERFFAIKNDFEEKIASKLGLKEPFFIPISALEGDNIIKKSEKTAWYDGLSLIDILDSLDASKEPDNRLRASVQYVNRPNPDFRGFCATIEGGTLSVADEITVFPSGKKTRIKEIIRPDVEDGAKSRADVKRAFYKEAITFTTEEEVDISRGDVIAASEHPPLVTSSFTAHVVWMDEEPLELSKGYDIKLGFQNAVAKIVKIEHKIDPNSYERKCANTLELNDIALCRIECDRAVVVDPYIQNKAMGSMIFIDRATNKTAGAAMIVEGVCKEEQKEFVYSEFEIELNALIRKHFPHWESRALI